MKSSHLLTLGVGAMLLATPAFADEGHKEKGQHKEKKAKASELVKDAKVSIEQAIKTATDKASGTVVEAELEREHGKTVWEIEIVGADGAETEVVIDAADGTVLESKKKGEKHGDKH